ncbi:hypothetical protein Gogos_007365 [Gossypium gossypioides]|uniref:Phospholipase/carboxylesterase/thioesterase domain-containing protein n=1 Tax=Gossypium gossypioides TaxID=34282 RepID=A0A7J9C8C9_GOSGO|nr:hypothetical protein [Gossypium gossypioides]
MGAATSLYSATCFTHGKYENGNPYPAKLSAVVGLSGWLPCSKTLKNKIGQDEAARRAASLPILLCHGKGDDVVPHKFGEKSSRALSSNGFQDTTFKSYGGLGHYTIPEEMDEVCAWLTSKLGLEVLRCRPFVCSLLTDIAQFVYGPCWNRVIKHETINLAVWILVTLECTVDGKFYVFANAILIGMQKPSRLLPFRV